MEELTMKEKMLAIFRKEEGLTIVEYAVAAGLIAAATVAAFVALGGSVEGIIQGLADLLAANQPPAP
ncbi:MAG: Flp family type IVb pilin [Gammaproteobacteria bacterium]